MPAYVVVDTEGTDPATCREYQQAIGPIAASERAKLVPTARPARGGRTMAEGVRLYAGTQHGLFVWRSRNGGWDEVYRGFPDGVFDSIAGGRQHPETVYACLADGLVRTTDAGLHWSRVLAPDGDVRAVAVDPTDDRVVYVGTEPVRLYRSEDGGDTWEELTALPAMPEEVRQKWWTPYPPGTGHIRNIFIHPDDANVLYLCLEHGGVVRSFDRGASWEDVTEGIEYVDMHL